MTTGQVAHIWRHPIKSHGREELTSVALTAGQTLPWDRTWAVAHEAAKLEGGAWVPCANFSRTAKAPALAAIEAQLDVTSGQLTLTHPQLGTLTFDPDREGPRLIDWAGGLIPEGRASSAQLVRATEQGMTDSDYPSISLLNMSSHRAVCDALGQDLSAKRWRGNFWLEGLAPWEEFDWIGKTLRLGGATVEVRERIQRCMATTANPETGQRDADTLGALNTQWGHQDFGVYGVVIESGTVAKGDTVGLA